MGARPGSEILCPETTDHPLGGKLASVCLVLSCLACFVTCFVNAWLIGGLDLGHLYLCRPEKELTSSDFSPAALEDVPRAFGARFVGAQPVSEGYVVLVRGEGSGPSVPPFDFLLSILDRSVLREWEQRRRSAPFMCYCLLSVFCFCVWCSFSLPWDRL